MWNIVHNFYWLFQRSATHNELPTCLPGLSNDTPESPQSADSNNNAANVSASQDLVINNTDIITPSISLIPIKQVYKMLKYVIY